MVLDCKHLGVALLFIDTFWSCGDSLEVRQDSEVELATYDFLSILFRNSRPRSVSR